MKIVIDVLSEDVHDIYADTDTITLDGSGLTVNGSNTPRITAAQYRLVENVTAEVFLLGLINENWRYHA